MTQTTNKNAPAAATGRGEANNQRAAGIFAFNDTRNRHEVQFTADQERREPTPEYLREVAEAMDLQIRRCELIREALLIQAALIERGDL